MDPFLALRQSNKKASRLVYMIKPVQARALPLIYIMMVYKITNNNINIISNINQHDNNLHFIDDSNLWKLIHQYWKVFYDSLSKTLLSEQDIKNAIETGDAKPININAYLLSKLYINK